MRADAKANRNRLIEVAREGFGQRGLALSIHEIARNAGVGVGTVYRHFPTKDSLFEAIILGRVERLVDLARSLAGNAGPGEAFFQFLRAWVAEGVAKRDLVDAITAEGFDVRRATSGAAQELRGAIGNLLTHAQEAGAVRADIDFGDLMALLAGTSLALRQAGDAKLAARLLAVVSDGLRAGAARQV